jgi:biopolymer transport protein ExbB
MIALSVVGVVLCFLALERFLSLGSQIRSLSSELDSHHYIFAERLRLTGLRRMGIIRACIVIAPLLGLLGTVTGMIETFDTICHGGYVTEMSRGICKALLTTQYGLAIAAPGLLAERVLLRRQARLDRLLRASRLLHGKGESCIAAC